MRTAAAALVLLMLALVSAAAQPRVRVAITPIEPALVGQAVRLDVTVLAPNFFLSPPQFPTFDLPGAIVTLIDENALNSTETIDGESFAGIRRSYSIVPQQAGDLVLPPAEITFRYAAVPGQPAVAATVTLPPQHIAVKPPAGAPATAAPALVAKVTITQTLDRDPKDIKAGDALTRTVETFAANTRAMLIPPPTFEAPAGVRIYPRDPVVTDVTTDRGGFAGGRRVDTATYVFATPGTYALPAIDIGWFNAETAKQDVATAPAIGVTVAPAPASTADLAPPAPASDGDAAAASATRAAWLRAALRLIGTAVIVVGLAWSARRFGPDLAACLRAHRAARAASEPACFARLKQSCTAADAAAAYRELGVWARRRGGAGIRALAAAEPTLRRDIDALERHLYGARGAEVWSGAALIASVAAVRAAGRASAHRHRRAPALQPALNP